MDLRAGPGSACRSTGRFAAAERPPGGLQGDFFPVDAGATHSSLSTRRSCSFAATPAAKQGWLAAAISLLPLGIVPDGSSAQRMSIPTSKRAGTVFMLLLLLRGASVSCWGTAAFKCLGTGWGGGEAGRVCLCLFSLLLRFLEAFCIRQTLIVQLLKKRSCCIAQLCCAAAPEGGLGEQPLSSPWAVVGCPAALTPFSRLRHDGDLLCSLWGFAGDRQYLSFVRRLHPCSKQSCFFLWVLLGNGKLTLVGNGVMSPLPCAMVPKAFPWDSCCAQSPAVLEVGTGNSQRGAPPLPFPP